MSRWTRWKGLLFSHILLIEDMIDRVKPVRTHYPFYSQKSTMLWIWLCFGFGRGCMVCHCCLPILLSVVVLRFGEMMKVCYMKSTFPSIAIRLNLSWGSLGRMVGHLCPTCQFSQGASFTTITIMKKVQHTSSRGRASWLGIRTLDPRQLCLHGFNIILFQLLYILNFLNLRNHRTLPP